ncbi:hypothetical protein, partial [Klebsiella pneumoniae]|uniref:hypothetical protein n=1 Tax=Klebsiella pneumoniae TaxID=573 RepID=UPI002730D24A
NAHKIAHDTRAKLKSDVEARRGAAETALAEKLADAEKHIADLKTAALSNVGEIATDTTTARVEALIGKAPTKAELTKAVDSA